MERFIEFVCRPRAVHFETTSSEIVLKICVFVLCIFLKLESAPYLMKTWTVFSPYFFPANPAVLSHASLLEADIAHPGAERALPRPPRPSVWWSSKPLALVPSIHSVQSRRKTGPHHRASGCSTLYMPGIAASHPGAY